MKSINIKMAAILLSALLMFSLSSCGIIDYCKAQKLYKEGNYAEAAELFASSDGFMDSDDMLKTCKYDLAIETYDEGNFEEAQKLFEELGDYEDCAEYIASCKYCVASMLMQEYEYDSLEKALGIFESLNDYENSADQVIVCRYEMAYCVYNDGEFERAAELFAELGDYSDSADMALQCRFDQAYDLYMQENYAEARSIFKELGSFYESAELADDCGYIQAQQAADSGDLETALELYKELDDFRDSSNIAKKIELSLAIKDIIGTWNIAQDVTESFQQGLLEGLEGDEITELTVPELNVYWKIEITDTGRLTMSIDDEKSREAFDSKTDDIVNLMRQIVTFSYENACREQNVSLDYLLEFYKAADVEELWQINSGKTLEEYAKESLSWDIFKASVGSPVIGGSLEYVDGTFKINLGSDVRLEGITMTCEGDKITLSGGPSDGTMDLFDSNGTLVLTRAK